MWRAPRRPQPCPCSPRRSAPRGCPTSHAPRSLRQARRPARAPWGPWQTVGRCQRTRRPARRPAPGPCREDRAWPPPLLWLLGQRWSRLRAGLPGSLRLGSQQPVALPSPTLLSGPLLASLSPPPLTPPPGQVWPRASARHRSAALQAPGVFRLLAVVPSTTPSCQLQHSVQGLPAQHAASANAAGAGCCCRCPPWRQRGNGWESSRGSQVRS
mmetsp:Transcript_111527/g.359985  ORF Transcript_111527/g.359985 Transcript_111527/m.359985 type:complete len:213 (+) Transcript_111527:269-907(+)